MSLKSDIVVSVGLQRNRLNIIVDGLHIHNFLQFLICVSYVDLLIYENLN